MEVNNAHFGDIAPLTQFLQKKKIRKVFIVSGRKSFILSGAEALLNSIFEPLNISCHLYNDFSTNPKSEDVSFGIALLHKHNPDCIIAAGGGSVIDMAKLIRYFSSCASSEDEKLQCKPFIPLVAIPTTAGTGSESTHFAVMYKNGVKTSVEHECIRPDFAFIIPELTYSNSPYLTACSGFDAIAQAIEAVWNVNATSQSDEWAKKALGKLLPNIVVAVNSQDVYSRAAMSEGSYYAGRAIDITKTTAPHAFSYGLTSEYGYPHGHAVALCFVEIMKYNFTHNWPDNERKNFLLNVLDKGNAETASNYIKGVINDIGLNVKPMEYSLTQLCTKVNSSRLSNNPCPINEADIARIYSNSLF